MIAEQEHKLYKSLWNNGYQRSQCAIPIARSIIDIADKKDKILEIGCGDCTSLDILINKGLDATGSDIAATRDNVIECPAWKLPFRDNSFDITYSTDVMEHLPTEMVDNAIQEILRVTRKKSIHVIALWEDYRNGETLHKTVKPITWWKEKFNQLNTKGIELQVYDRSTWL